MTRDAQFIFSNVYGPFLKDCPQPKPQNLRFTKLKTLLSKSLTSNFSFKTLLDEKTVVVELGESRLGLSPFEVRFSTISGTSTPFETSEGWAFTAPPLWLS